MQFYIVVYHFRFAIRVPDVVDRFQIDLELSIASDFTERKTYYGLQNLTQFDMSFKIARQCSDNYYDPQCDVFCSEVAPFTCDSEGNTVCVNSNLNPESSCTECLEEGQDSDNNCGITGNFIVLSAIRMLFCNISVIEFFLVLPFLVVLLLPLAQYNFSCILIPQLLLILIMIPQLFLILTLCFHLIPLI